MRAAAIWKDFEATANLDRVACFGRPQRARNWLKLRESWTEYPPDMEQSGSGSLALS